MHSWTPGQIYFRLRFSGLIQFPDCVFSPGLSPLETYSAPLLLLLPLNGSPLLVPSYYSTHKCDDTHLCSEVWHNYSPRGGLRMGGPGRPVINMAAAAAVS